MSHPAEPDSTPELSPVATNDGDPEGTGFLSNRNNDEVDDDDPFSKRRFDSLGSRPMFLCATHVCLLTARSFL